METKKSTRSLLESFKDSKLFPPFLKLLFGVLTCVFAFILAKPIIEPVISVYASGESKKLPIYSVETSAKKVAITFDAAW